MGGIGIQEPHAKTFGRSYYFEKEEIFAWEMAVLVEVSIPIFTSQLEKSRESTDMANMRAAKAAFLDDDTYTGGFYDAMNGVIVSEKGDITAYGKGTAIEGTSGDLFAMSMSVTTENDEEGNPITSTTTYYTGKTVASGKVIKVAISNGTLTLTWE